MHVEAAMLGSPTIERRDILAAVVARIATQHGITREIGASDHLVDSGMSSIAMVDLMLAIEAEFDITLPNSALTPANFLSIDALDAMLASL